MFATRAPMQVSVADLAIDLIRTGTGPKLLYLHAGHGIDADDRFISCLAERFEVFAPSHPGFGNSDLPRSFSSVDDLSYFYLDFMEANDLDDCLVVGSSFGGWVALQLAIKRLKWQSGLVLLAPLGVRFPGSGARDLLSVAVADLPAMLTHDPAAGRRAFGDLDFPAMDDDAVLRFARNREALTLFGWSPVLHDPALLHRLHRVSSPALILSGAEDRVLPSGHCDQLASALPNAQVETLDGAGHYIHLDRPDEAAARILRWHAHCFPAPNAMENAGDRP